MARVCPSAVVFLQQVSRRTIDPLYGPTFLWVAVAQAEPAPMDTIWGARSPPLRRPHGYRIYIIQKLQRIKKSDTCAWKRVELREIKRKHFISNLENGSRQGKEKTRISNCAGQYNSGTSMEKSVCGPIQWRHFNGKLNADKHRPPRSKHSTEMRPLYWPAHPRKTSKMQAPLRFAFILSLDGLPHRQHNKRQLIILWV